MFTIEIYDPDKAKWDRFIRNIEGLSYMDLQAEGINLAESTMNEMATIIKESKKRPDKGNQNLENHLTTKGEGWEILKSTGGIIIGLVDIDKMKSLAPYFELLNDGGSFVTKRTHVVPMGAWSGVGQWIEGAGTTFWTDKEGTVHPITGIRYMDIAFVDLEKKLDTVIILLGGKIMQEVNNY